jgi:acetyl esterase/lipase
MNALRVLLLVPVLLLCGCKAPKNQHDPRTKAILTRATRVEVFRIHGDPAPINPADPTIDGIPLVARGKDQGPEFAARLADVLLDDKTYTNNFMACFWPGVAFRVYNGEDCVDVVICFECGNFYLGPPRDVDKPVMQTAAFAGSPSTPRLIRLAKEAFPDDAEMQALEEK